MTVGIIADTHDNIAAVERAVDLFESHGVETVIHCGDVIAPPVLPFFDGFDFHLVLGNNDGEIAGLRATIDDLSPPGTCHGRFGVIEVGEMTIAMMHGERLEEVEAVARSGVADLVCYGHHHETRRESIGSAEVCNPGGHFPTIPADHRHVAILEPDTGSITLHQVSATDG